MNISKETKIGIMAIVAFSCLVWGYNFIKGENLFSKNTIYYSTYDNVDGLAPSCPILINGLQVGRVTDLALQSDNTIKATFSLNNGLKVPTNTVAEIKENNFLGGRSVIFLLGNDADLAPTHSELKGIKQESISESLDPLKAKLIIMLSRADSILLAVNNMLSPEEQKSIKSSIKSIEVSLTHVEGTTKNLDNSSRHFNQIFANVESITNNLTKNNDKITHIISNIDQVTDDIAKANIQQTLANADKAVSDVKSIMDKINNGNGTIGLLINDPQLYHNLNKTAADLDSLMADIKRNPKRYLNLSMFGGKAK